jgi:lysophospholipase L1-like esterase
VTAPLRVVVAGNSAASFLSPPRTVRSDGAYPELLREELCTRGLAAEVFVRSEWLGVVRDLRRDYDRVVRDRMPDVVVLNVGIIEAQPNALPLWLVRHLASWDRSGGLLARAYRQKIANPLWPVFRRYQQLLAGLPTYRVRPRAFRAELTRLIALTRRETRALVLVLDTDPAGDRIEHWMPGMGPRRARYQALLAEVVDRFGPDVRLLRASDDLVGREAELLPDGLHRNSEGHRLIAVRIAEEIATWHAEEDGSAKDDPQAWV